MEKNDIAIEVKNYSKKYKIWSDYVLKDISFNVKKGEFHGFIGANGSGKTTTIKSLIGAYAKYDGDISMFGFHSRTINAKKLIGYIPEAASFPKNFSAYKYIYHMSRIAGIKRKDAKIFAKKKLSEIGLGPLMNKSPNTFSSGQKKKVLLAQALVHDPMILIMDEPAANLDPEARMEFFSHLKELQKEGKTIFISSHILAELNKFVDSITILDGGQVAYTGGISGLKSKSTLEYKVFTENNDIVIEWLKKSKLSFVIREENLGKKSIIAQLENKTNVTKLLNFITKSNINVIEFRENLSNLEDIYSKFVKKGSVNTKGEHSIIGKNKERGKNE